MLGLGPVRNLTDCHFFGPGKVAYFSRAWANRPICHATSLLVSKGTKQMGYSCCFPFTSLSQIVPKMFLLFPFYQLVTNRTQDVPDVSLLPAGCHKSYPQDVPFVSLLSACHKSYPQDVPFVSLLPACHKSNPQDVPFVSLLPACHKSYPRCSFCFPFTSLSQIVPKMFLLFPFYQLVTNRTLKMFPLFPFCQLVTNRTLKMFPLFPFCQLVTNRTLKMSLFFSVLPACHKSYPQDVPVVSLLPACCHKSYPQDVPFVSLLPACHKSYPKCSCCFPFISLS